MLGVGLLLVAAGIFIKPSVVSVTPNARDGMALASPLKIRFNVPVVRRLISPVIEPEIEGSWHWEGGINNGHLARTYVFEPETIWQPDQEYSVKISGVAQVLRPHQSKNEEISFLTKSLPTIVSASISDSETELSPEAEIAVKLDQPLASIVDFSFRLEPETELTVNEDPVTHQYRLKPTQPLHQGQQYRLLAEREILQMSRSSGAVINRIGKTLVFERAFRTKTPPAVSEFQPQGNAVLPLTNEIKIGFTMPMVRQEIDQAITISPPLEGKWQWESDQAFVFKIAQPLPRATNYQVVIAAGVHAQNSSFFENATALNFATVGALKVASATPSKKAGVSIDTTIKLVFDQPIQQNSVAAKLAIDPPIAYDAAWAPSSVVLKPTAPLVYNVTYRVTVNKGAESLYGLPSVSDYTTTFSTEEKVVLLNIAWDRQDRALSCEAAALKMALAYKGVQVSEDEIMNQIGYDPTPRTAEQWGDPDIAFVGDINGAQNTTGYGVHWGPVARAASTWRPTQALSGMSVNEIARELEAGNPVVVWGVTGPAHAETWLTPAGRTINVWKGEHARTVIGFKGSVDSPTSFVLNDPLAGRISWATAKFKGNWATFGSSAVVVR